MKDLQFEDNPEVALIFENYPDPVRKKMLDLRNLVIETAREIESVTHLEEALKWGEPSYLTKHDSTIRMDWKPRSPDVYAMYFQCTTRLVETFRRMFKNTLEFDGKRAIVFKLENEFPREPIKHCIKAALTYHKVKHLPMLGI